MSTLTALDWSAVGDALLKLIGGGVLFTAGGMIYGAIRSARSAERNTDVNAATAITSTMLTAQNAFAANLNAQIDNLTRRMAAAEDKSIQQQGLLDAANTEIQQLKTQLEEERRVSVRLTHQLRDQQSQHEEVVTAQHNEIIMLNRTLREVRSECDELRVKCEEMKVQLDACLEGGSN